jgi:hypothetical protein
VMVRTGDGEISPDNWVGGESQTFMAEACGLGKRNKESKCIS